MADDNNAKRQRVEAQQSAYQEDMALIRSAMGNNSESSAYTAATSDTAGSNGAAGGEGDTQQQSGESNVQNGQESRESTSRQQQQQSSQQLRQQAQETHHAPRRDSEDEEDGGKWMQSYTQHHTRVGSDYQVASLPHVALAIPPPADPTGSSSCVSPGHSCDSSEG
eukprot:CAMPEP_0172536546 /NCGR_PEP_ID=MMETSP1067-20121228/8295_1 /TAXON_ID=265564 ORGANISM="Thalassiosira punctigera, Strain Tpunct2005C2" /NCGR_SAMPLE_ID=MMETSP1067 /ASSEMBLY_ACC=CAM_ASM_000444 /LENGTH=165 /DNA_ID=CAMNT_0013321643 /DNA_START=295 /DNA_END=792 /DNA_ORIENTATION=+